MAVPSQFNNRLAPLGAFGGEFDTFTGLAEETNLGNVISVNYSSDQPTYLQLQQSPDGENWYINDDKLLAPNTEHIFQHPAVLEFFRVIIQNRGLIDQEYGNLVTSLVQIQSTNIEVIATIGDISPTKDGVLTYGMNGASPLATRVDASGSLITTFSATGASAASATVWGKDSLGASYPLPLTTGGEEIAMSITDPLPAGNNSLGKIQLQARNTYGQGVMDLTSVDGINGVNEPTQSLAVAQTAVVGSDQYFNNEDIFSSVGAYGALQSLYDTVKNTGQKILPIPLSNENDILTLAASTKATVEGDTTKAASSAVAYGTDGTNYYSMPLTAGGSQVSVAVSNHPAVQDISGTVTVASITEPVVVASISGALPGGSNIIGATYMLAIDDGAGGGDEVYLSSKVTGIDPVSQITIHALHTYVDNLPEVQVVAGRETPYIGFATPATNIPAVWADGIAGINVTGGWLYSSTQVGVAPYTGSRNKINWYLYNSATPDTDFAVSQISNVYAVINQKSTLGVQAQLPFFTIYTRPDSGVNNGGTFFKNRLTFGGQSFPGTMGQMLLYTGEDPVAIHPEITGANRLRLDFNLAASTTTLAAASGEGAYLASLQTDSDPKPNGTRNFVFSEFSMMWEQSAIPLPISQNQVQVFDKALNASAATLVTDLSGITITANKLQVGGTVAVSNFPATQPVSGSVSVSNLPATQPVSGSVSVSNLPATQPVSGTFWQATQPVSGTFWQATQPVSGTVAISNFPEGGSNVTIVSPLPAGTNAIGSVTVSNFPAGGSEVSVTNFPATQPISGTVAISNFPEGGSEVSVVSALPTGANVIGAVNINSSFYTAQNYSLFDVTYGDGVSVAHYIPQYKSVDLMLSVNQVNNPDTQDGMTLNIQVSNDGQTFGTIPNYSMNFKGQNPATLAINNIETNAIWVRAVALKDKNPSSMSMYAIFTIMAKY